MKQTALIMAGGRGERFWPKSRKSLPKQFLSLTGNGKTMIQLTVERISPLVDIKDVYIATNKDYKQLVKEQLPDLPEENILCEPVGRNTAPCIALGAVHISKKYDDALMMVLASDNLVKDCDAYVEILKEGLTIAEEGPNLVTIGIKPNYPETGYGYIKFLPDKKKGNAYEVDRFVEKPDLEKAKEYVASGEYVWNSGMFIWKVSTILENLHTFVPAMDAGLAEIKDSIGTPSQDEVLERVFPNFPSDSIDYAVMEKASHIHVFPGDFGWDDVGSWLAVGRIRENDAEGNTISGDVVTVSTTNTVIEGGKKLIAAVGLKDMIIVDTDDALLVCDQEHAGEIKKVLEALKNGGRDELV